MPVWTMPYLNSVRPPVGDVETDLTYSSKGCSLIIGASECFPVGQQEDNMVAISTDILHEQNFEASKEAECYVGADSIMRINIDGVCALRIRLKDGCSVVYRNDTTEVEDLSTINIILP